MGWWELVALLLGVSSCDYCLGPTDSVIICPREGVTVADSLYGQSVTSREKETRQSNFIPPRGATINTAVTAGKQSRGIMKAKHANRSGFLKDFLG